jgi:uncharacterized membrane protein
MAAEGSTEVVCEVCKQEKARSETVPAAIVRGPIVDTIRERHADWSPDGNVCSHCLNEARAQHVEDLLKAERGELSELESEVAKSMQDQELLTKDLNKEFDSQLSFGQRLADRIADFGGSWAFIIIFMSILLVWIAGNCAMLVRKPFDPYPFILLNLVLSCLAAMQAPVIMMSQNRQESKDRLRAEHDYRVNLKAELEIRNLHQKVDHLLKQQWERLTEIQEMQVEQMDQVAGQAAPANSES